ncbi:TetR/AcrR family transcriptional regulator [Mycobacterium sp. AMU20-3851]|uniref:TetR/AcrR family transcriptional regulator n=1 Tax=Mycobacterium sp. AMU20-3851 TaxID=3122055 RepID=UPI003754542D
MTEAPRRPPGRPQGSHIDAQQRREELLDAAERSLRSRGPELSLVDVARESGLTRSALYGAFPDKEALVAALAHRQAQRIITEVSGIVVSTADPREQTRAAVDCFCAWVEAEPAISAALGASLSSAAVFDELAGWLEGILTVAFDQLDGNRRAAGPWARALLGAMSASVFWWQRDRTVERDELVEHLTALIWSGFVGAGGQRLRTLGTPGPS